jgi:hypothetical protein
MELSKEEKDFRVKFDLQEITQENLDKKKSMYLIKEKEIKYYQIFEYNQFILIFRYGEKVINPAAIYAAIHEKDFDYLRTIPENYPNAKFLGIYKIKE